jgi:hypothetical protein
VGSVQGSYEGGFASTSGASAQVWLGFAATMLAALIALIETLFGGQRPNHMTTHGKGERRLRTRNRLRYLVGFTGSDYFRTAVDAGGSLEEIIVGWQDELSRFRAIRSRYLIHRGR